MMTKPLYVLMVMKTFRHGRTLNRFVDEFKINFNVRFDVCYAYDETFEHGQLIYYFCSVNIEIDILDLFKSCYIQPIQALFFRILPNLA